MAAAYAARHAELEEERDARILVDGGYRLTRVTPIDQIWYAMTTPKVPDDRIALLSGAFAKAFEDKLVDALKDSDRGLLDSIRNARSSRCVSRKP